MRDADDDARQMLAFAAGDAAAFDALFERWSRPLLRYLERLVPEPAIAEELLQETFLRVHRARDRYEPKARFSTWLYRIATNLAFNELRRPRQRDPHQSLDDAETPELVAPDSDVDQLAHARREFSRLEVELAALPERQRSALWLASVEGHSYAEVAEVLGSTESAVKALVHRARTALAQTLGPAASEVGT